MIVDWILFFKTMNILTYTEFTLDTTFHLCGFIFIVLNLLATQFSVAHEIFHKQGFNKYIGTIHMIKNMYMHFTYEHLYGHHRKVATP